MALLYRMLCPLALIVFCALPLASHAQTATRENVNAALPKLASYVTELIEKDAVPGLAVAVVFRDEVVYLNGFGVKQEGKPGLVDANTVFQLASMSKPISSTVVAAIVSEGTVTWDSRIADLDPGFELFEAFPTEQVTLRDLFSHRSGLPGDAGNELEALGFNRDAILHQLRLVRPASSFRSGYSYSNFGLTEGAVAAAKAAKLSWEEATEEKLFKPLEMTSTSSRYADFLSRSNRASLHVSYNGKWQSISKRAPDAQAPAGGVSSNVRDLAQWMRLVLGHGKYNGRQLIQEDAIGQTLLPVIARGNSPITGRPKFYALGWNINYGRYGTGWGHAGAFSNGARTVVSLLPSHQIGIVVLANAFPTGAPEAIADTFFDLVFQGKPTRDWLTDWNKLYDSLFGPAIKAAKKRYETLPVTPSPALAHSAYIGNYANDYFGEAVIGEENGGLMLKLGPHGQKSFALGHFDRDNFISHPFDEMPNMPSGVTFQVGPDQKAHAVTIENLNDLGMGTFSRASN